LKDKTGAGTITPQDLRILIKALGQNPPDSELNSIISDGKSDSLLHSLVCLRSESRIQAERKGGVDFQFFLQTMARWVGEAESEAEMIAAWRMFDRQGVGYITQEDFRHAMTSFGESLDPGLGGLRILTTRETKQGIR
jgi:calmodulin